MSLCVDTSSICLSKQYTSQLYRLNKTDTPGIVCVLCSSQLKIQLDTKHVSVIICFLLKLQVFHIFHMSTWGDRHLKKRCVNFIFVCLFFSMAFALMCVKGCSKLYSFPGNVRMFSWEEFKTHSSQIGSRITLCNWRQFSWGFSSLK